MLLAPEISKRYEVLDFFGLESFWIRRKESLLGKIWLFKAHNPGPHKGHKGEEGDSTPAEAFKKLEEKGFLLRSQPILEVPQSMLEDVHYKLSIH